MALIPLAALMGSIWLQVAEVRDQSIRNVNKIVGMLADDLQQDLFDRREALEKAAVSLRSLHSDALSEDVLAHLLYNAGRRFSQTVYIDGRGRLKGFASGLSGSSARAIRDELVGMWVYRHAQRRHQSAMSDAYRINGESYVMVAVPVLDHDGSGVHAGMLASRIALSDLLEDLCGSRLPPHTEFQLHDRNGTLVADFGLLSDPDPLKAIVPIRALDWQLSYFAPQGVILSRAHVTALGGILLVILIAVGSYWAGRIHLKQLSHFFEEMTLGIRSISQGDLSVRSRAPNVSGMPEANLIFREFEAMAASLRKSRAEIRAINAGLEVRVAERTAQLTNANTELSAIAELVCPIASTDDGETPSFSSAFERFKDARHLEAVRLLDGSKTVPAGYCVELPHDRLLQAVKPGGLSKDDELAVDRFAGFLSVVLENEALFHETQAQHGALTALFTAMSEGFALLSHEGVPVFVNQRFRQMLCLSEEGRRAFVNLTEPHKAPGETVELWNHVLAHSGEPCRWAATVPGGKSHHFILESFPVRLNEKGGTGILIRDVTHEHEIGRLKDDVVALVSHELNNPVSTLALGLETLRDRSDRLPPEWRSKILENLIAETARLKELIHDWLDISMLNNGVMPCVKTRIDLAALLGDAVDHWSSANGMAVELHLPPRKVETDGDARRLVQVFSNLLDNALRYNDKKEKRIAVTLAEPVDGWIAVDFEDNGIGMTEVQQQQIFERFFRTDEAKRHAPNGSGLGLAICRGIAAAHDGSLTVSRSTPGAGTCFTFRLPIPMDEHETHRSQNSGC